MAYRVLTHRKIKRGEGSTSRYPEPGEFDEDELVARVEKVLREALSSSEGVNVVIEHGVYKDVLEIASLDTISLLPEAEHLAA